MLFETEADRDHEQAIADRMKVWLDEHKNRKRTFNKLAGNQPVDFAICAGHSITGYLECKSRTFNSDRFNNVMIDQSKLIDLLNYASGTPVPVWLAVSYTDEKLFLTPINAEIKNDILETRWLQRKHRRWVFDNKPIVLLNRSNFISIP